jgi:hypothetical protein
MASIYRDKFYNEIAATYSQSDPTKQTLLSQAFKIHVHDLEGMTP